VPGASSPSARAAILRAARSKRLRALACSAHGADAMSKRAILSYERARRSFLPQIEQRITESRIVSGSAREMVDYHLAAGGKRMRAVLPAWTCHSLGGAPEDAFDFGAGLEMMHNATLIHDDVQDGDTHRRGRPTVWRAWGSAHAINAGDALIFEALTRIARAPAAARVVGAICIALARLTEGQVMDLESAFPAVLEGGPPPTLDRWESVARRKSGELFSACLRAGGAAAGAADDLLEHLSDYGEEAGALFQLQDDLLDLVGSKGRERRGADLREGKLSYLVAWVYERGSPALVAPIHGLLARPRAERTWDMVEKAIDALHRCGAIEAAIASVSARRIALESSPITRLLPGWISHCVAPIAHVLGSSAGGGAPDQPPFA
jgi:geranylgeranyl pyrophosphate synthase